MLSQHFTVTIDTLHFIHKEVGAGHMTLMLSQHFTDHRYLALHSTGGLEQVT